MPHTLSDKTTKWLYFFIIIAVLVNFSGLFVVILGPDGALYASIAKTMALNNNFMELFVDGKDWLDKPHFPFWITALSFKIFGISTWAYKLPGVLFSMLGAWYTYRFGTDLYGRKIGLWAVLIYLTAIHLVISNMDVRAEPFLTGLIIASVYYFYKAKISTSWFLPILLGSVFAGCAVMTKGIFALIPICGAIAGEIILKKQWPMLFNVRWLVAAILIFVCIFPELYSLYFQFDLHPEKVVFGQTHVSGLKFFFWDSQFGRFFNTGPIQKSSGDPSFFLHTILWAFLPWSLLFYASIVQFIKVNIRKIQQVEWYCISATLLTTFIFSASKFQLPHYIIIVFPFFAILTAQYVCRLKFKKTVTTVRITQLVVIILMLVTIGLLHYFFAPKEVPVLAVVFLIGGIGLFIAVSLTPTNGQFKILFQCCSVVFLVNIYFNLIYYPNLVRYQADNEAAFWLNEHNKAGLPVVQKKNGHSHAMSFYLDQPLWVMNDGGTVPPPPYILFADAPFIEQLRKEGKSIELLKNFDQFRVTRVNGTFLNHETRSEAVSTDQLVVIR